MPSRALTVSGVGIEELADVAPPIEGVPTAVTALLGAAARGPVNHPIRVRSFADYQQKFGALGSALELGYAVAQFFANGGQEAWVVRIARRPNARQIAKGLAALERLDTIGLIALPGLTRRDTYAAASAFAREHRAFFIADPPADAATPEDMLALAARGLFPDEPNAAVYYPWLQIANPVAPGQLRRCAPSGTVAGIFARTDAARGVWHAPSGREATLHGVDALAVPLTEADGERLNPRGINGLRTFPGLGSVVWGARTLASDPDWKYVSVRRLFLFIESSIARGLQWVVFEPNGEPLWTQVRTQIEMFLTGRWRDGALQGVKPEQAFFVRCDRTTMTQDDLDQGRLVVEIGIAPLRPAEFVIFRIGQWTLHHSPS